MSLIRIGYISHSSGTRQITANYIQFNICTTFQKKTTGFKLQERNVIFFFHVLLLSSSREDPTRIFLLNYYTVLLVLVHIDCLVIALLTGNAKK